MPFDLSMTKLLVLGVIAMIVFGPDKLPQVARDAGRMLRQFRAFAQQARTELKSELGDAVGDFDLEDLNPKRFVRKHLLEGFDDTAADVRASVADIRSTVSSAGSSTGSTARSTVGTAAASAVMASAVVASTGSTSSTGAIGSTVGGQVGTAQLSSPVPFDADAT
ncbi:MAG: sec-independent translocase [Acidothermaceae bacterium]